ncbi:MAG: hypothetical protein MJD61_03615 [Proteobacteria bacterium]|nr:hypothetical protein [Pseudomonadota bacterium]
MLPRPAHAGESFTLVATERNTRDMSVNLAADALRGDTFFGGRKVQAPSLAVGRDELAALLNHDDGVLDVQHTFFVRAALSARTLIHFQTLEDELRKHCWTKENASKLRARLRLYVVPPYGPRTHHRLWGTAPTVYTPATLDIDPPPASVPIAVFRQIDPWIEGPGQNSFFTATYGEQYLLDVKRVGVRTRGTWHGVAVEPVDVCLNREPGLEARSWQGEQLALCHAPPERFDPWVEWDVTEAVRFWLERDFAPEIDHGFSLYQYPGEIASDQVRINAPEIGLGRSRAVVTFASSSAAADCPGAGGEWGGPGGVDLVYGNTRCMRAVGGEVRGAGGADSPQIVKPRVRREWAPQLVVESSDPSGACHLAASSWTSLDTLRGERVSSELILSNRSVRQRIAIERVRIAEGQAFRLREDGCSGTVLDESSAMQDGHAAAPEAAPDCSVRIDMLSDRLGPKQAMLEVSYRLAGATGQAERRFKLTGTVSEDRDGVPDAVEDAAAHNGDGNGDGVPDRRQDHVASFQNRGREVVTVAALPGTRLTSVGERRLAPPAALANVEFTHGFVGFRLSGLARGDAAAISVALPDEGLVDFYSFGPLENGGQARWYSASFDGKRGARMEGRYVKLVIEDGQLGDADFTVNGEIAIVGGAGKPRAQPLTQTTNAAVGLLCSVADAGRAGGGAGWLPACLGLLGSLLVVGRSGRSPRSLQARAACLGFAAGLSLMGCVGEDLSDTVDAATEAGTGHGDASGMADTGGAEAGSPPDAAREAGRPDAGTGDGSAGEGGAPADAGTPDAGAGTPDAGAGTPDAGAGDAGIDAAHEAGLSPDGAAGDAGAIEAGGPPDAGGSGDASNGDGGATAPTAVFVDTGYYVHVFSSSATLQSAHWQSPAGEHQSYFVGNQNVPAFDVERRAYFVFELSGSLSEVASATLQLWVWQPATANANSGAYTSGDAAETLELYSVDSFTPQQVMEAPFNQENDHSLDVPIWTDLGDGTLLGSRVYTVQDEQVGLMPSPTAGQGVACGADSPCGKWVQIALGAEGVASLKAAGGQWALGARLGTIGPNANSKEWVNNGTLVDLASTKSVYPAFVTPAPRLYLKDASMP